MFFFFFFKQKTAYEMRISDCSSDVCSSDLRPLLAAHPDGHLIGLDTNVLEAERLELGGGRGARARLGLGAGEAWADFGRQPFDDIPRDIVLERGVAQRGDIISNGGGKAGGQGLRGSGGGDRGGDREQRSEERRVGQGWGSTCRSRVWALN